jgi:hypothetical protein
MVNRMPVKSRRDDTLSTDYTARGIVLCIARQGKHINRKQWLSMSRIARQGIHFRFMNPLTGNREKRNPLFSIDMGASQKHADDADDVDLHR